ncbi:hypothetical protein HFO88_34845 [Rhizobium leguminosarum]|nr:hypothetical protein [Rhizobium leguminosarum]MBY5912527.1 hypothetical protein [Rhizobium leguminosarum]
MQYLLVGASYAAVRDIPEFNPMDEGEFAFHVPDPILSPPKDARPGFDGFFEKRQEGYAGLAAEAMDLIERMFEKFGLTLPTKPDYYRQREGIAEPDPTWVPSASPSRLASKIHLLDKRHH